MSFLFVEKIAFSGLCLTKPPRDTCIDFVKTCRFPPAGGGGGEAQEKEKWVESGNALDGSNFWCLSLKGSDSHFFEEPSYTMTVRNGVSVAFISWQEWFYKYFCIIQNLVGTDEGEVMMIIYCSQSKSTFKAVSYEYHYQDGCH